MFGIGFVKVQPTTYLIEYRNGRAVREGPGLSLFYFAPRTSLVAVPISSRDVPFIFLTGGKDRGHIPADLHDSPWLEKPVTFHELINAVELLKARSARASS